MLIVIALISIVGGSTLLMGMETYRGSSFRSDRDLLIATLQRARAEAINNVCLGLHCTNGMPHGVTREGDHYLLFQGTDIATRDTAVDAVFGASPLTIYQGSGPVVFSQLSATTTGSTIILSDQTGHTSTITIGTEGQISWTN